MSSEHAGAEGRIASLAMYSDPPAVAEATRAFWAYLRARLNEVGLAGVPERLDEEIAHDVAWLDARLLLAQTCGYPFVSNLRGRVRLVATPVYDHPGCVGVRVGSFVVVGAGSQVSSIDELRGKIAAVNDLNSNSGMNLLRGLIASFAVQGRFFGQVIESGGHIASLALVARGKADVAAIDCVTYGNLARFAPERVAGVRILAETAKTPGLPLITRAAASDEELLKLRAALARFAADVAMRPVRNVLGLRNFEVLPEEAYDAVMEIERHAAALGYSHLA